MYIDKDDDEYRKNNNAIGVRDRQIKLQELKNAPEFREYIRYLIKNIDKSQNDLRIEKNRVYQKRWRDKKEKKDRENDINNI
jgi:hypothetical protein